jgi:hypothetical protein
MNAYDMRYKQPHGTFDREINGRREIWFDGRIVQSWTKDFIDLYVAKHATAIVCGVKPWGSFPELTS